MLWHIPGYLDSHLEALKSIEAKMGGPVYMNEVLSEFKETSYWPFKYPFLTNYALRDLYLTDKILCDVELTRYSADPAMQSTEQNPTEFELYSDRMHRIAQTYRTKHFGFCNNNKIYPSRDTPVLNFQQMRDLLLSKDLDRDQELQWIKNNQFRFLDGQSMDGWHTGFCSFPRSGNSFLRRLLEESTGIFTGSDCFMGLVLDFQSWGLFGENHVGSEDNLVWITKTHYPWQVRPDANERPFTANK